MKSITGKMSSREIQQFNERLHSCRQEILNFLRRMEVEQQTLDTNRPPEVGDFCVQTASREYLFERSSQQRQLLQRVEEALRRIKLGSFGACIACGHEIDRNRLRAIPSTKYCLRCQQEHEKVAGNVVSSPHTISPARRAA